VASRKPVPATNLRPAALRAAPFRPTAFAAFAASLFAAGAESARAITVEAFAQTPAAAAYREGRYADALAAVDALLAREPADPILLRVRGMTLYRLGRFADAETALRGAVAAAPNDPAAQYWLGATLHERGERGGARGAFAAVERLAPGSRYAESAKEYAAALNTASPDPTARGERPWSLSITAGTQYDDNVSLVNTNRVASWRFFSETEGRYTIALDRGFALQLDGRAFGSGHFRSTADDFNVVSLTGGPTLVWRTHLGSKALRLSVGYAYEHVREGGRFYSDSHAMAARAETTLLPESVTGIGFVFAVDRYALLTAANPAVFSRDGTRYAAQLRHLHYLPGRRHYVWAGYEYTRYETEGRNFDADAHGGSAGASFALPWDMRLDLSAELVHTNYFRFADSPRRRSLKQTYSAWLTKSITANLSLQAAYAHTFDDSNIRDFETRRNVFTLSARYAF